MMLSSGAYEPRRTFATLNNDYLSKTGYKGGAVHMTHYQTNGTGRDGYIVRDNGGFCKMYEPNRYGDVGTFSPKRSYRAVAPAIQGKNIYYHSNGTGRDGYIVQTSGGFNNATPKLMEFRQAFQASLRKYERPNSAYTKLGGMTQGLRRTASTTTFQTRALAKEEIKKRDYLLESQLTFDHRYHEDQKNLRKSQVQMDVRLSQPKKVRAKFTVTSPTSRQMKTIEY